MRPGSEAYQASSILSQKIRDYNVALAKLLPYLKATTNLKEVDTEQSVDATIVAVST